MTTTTSSLPENKSLTLKSDTRGRMLTSVERREQLLDEFEKSGLSGSKYAALVGVKYQTFAAWALRRRKERGLPSPPPRPAKAAPSVRWLEAVMQDAREPGDGLWLLLPGDIRAEVVNARQAEIAARLVRALNQPC